MHSMPAFKYCGLLFVTKSQMFRLYMSGIWVKSQMHVNRFLLGAITGRMRGATIQYFSFLSFSITGLLFVQANLLKKGLP